MDDDNGHGPIRWTSGPQPRITHARHVRALTPGPLAGLLHVTPLDLAPIGQCEGVGTLSFHEGRALVGRRDMAHELRITKPTIRDDHRQGQFYTAPTKGCHAAIQHALHPVQFVPTWPSRPLRIGPSDSIVHGHHEFALSDHHDEQDAINTGEYPVFLPAPPGAHESQLLAILFEH